MKNKRNVLYSLIIMITAVVIFAVEAQQKNGIKDADVSTSQGPQSITRNIMQDRKGTIWMASWQGIFKYNGKSFTNVTSKVSSARLDGVYRYDWMNITDFNH